MFKFYRLNKSKLSFRKRLASFFILFLFLPFPSKGDLEKETYREKIRDNLHLFRACYEEELKNNPQLEGKVILTWEINKTGSVKKSSVKSSTLRSPVVESCMLKKLNTLKFPSPPDEYSVKVTYPFLFSKRK